MTKNKPFFLLFFILLLLLSCDTDRVFDDYRSIHGAWDKDDPATFNYTTSDTLRPYNLFINIRNTNTYKFSNLFLIVEMQYPHGKTIKDTLEYQMAKPNGELLGQGFTDIKENKLWYKGHDKPFVFSEKGNYEIKIRHAMRNNGQVNGVDKLEGITDVGFRIENKNK
ncbi:MAG TPA: gliding motility lipoprotein GldH [Aquaticitalea sp.]|nr:gliding motility lipoprotein GldH [Aquaticitalea sp.]HNU60512.1 gliding motility lipoprotein GldH [Aquaticitalea sp.]